MILNWLQNWYAKQCDGEWEHEYGVKIGNIDNPGWSVSIDLGDTKLDNYEQPYIMFENSDSDWYAYSVEGNTFKGVGDPQKLNKILEAFKEIWDSKVNI